MTLTSFLHDSHPALSLGGDWTLVSHSAHGGGRDISVPARVPGCVHLDLMAAGVIPDPFFGRNEEEVQWVARRDWRYERRFTLESAFPASGEGVRRQLVCEGLDTFAGLELDGEPLGRAENMFVPHRFDLPPSLGPGEHELAVTFRSPVNVVDALVAEKGPVPDTSGWSRGWARKAGYSYGWDWGPVLPTSGIFRPICLQTWRDARIAWFYPRFEMGREMGRLTLRVVVEVAAAGEYRLEAALSRGGSVVRTAGGFTAQGGASEVELILDLSDPALWWPRGVGEPALYDLDLALSRDGKPVHRIGERIGLRTVEWVQEKDRWGRSFFVRINGRDVFAKGANWIPADSFLPRVAPEIHRRQLALAAEAEMNMIRVWGGGVYEDPAFYREADRLGLMVWQDFPYACALYPDDGEFRANALREAESALARLCRHPSIVLWCGNNEIERDAEKLRRAFKTPFLGRSLWHEQLPDLARRIAPDAAYIPSSPIGGETPDDPREGDRHLWRIWSGWRDYPVYLEEEGRFFSEFGFQAPANPATWREALAPEDRHPQSLAFERHNKQIEGAERIFRFLAAHHRVPAEFERFVRLSQDVQGRALGLAVDHWRRRRPRTMGVLIWQLNDCWPVTSWSLFDYRMRPKAAWYHVRRGFRPRNIALLPSAKGLEVHLLNDEANPWRAEVRLRAFDTGGGVGEEMKLPAEVPPESVLRLAEIDPEAWLPDPERWFIVADITGAAENLTGAGAGDDSRLRREAGYSPRAFWFGVPFKHLRIEEADVTVEPEERDGAPGVLLRTDRPAFGVWLEDEENPDLMFLDNALDLLAGEERWVATVAVPTGEPMAAGRPRAHRI